MHNAAAFTDEVTQGGTYTDGAGNVRRISTKLRGIFGSPQPAVRQLFHYGNNGGKWAPTTGLREHQHAGYLDDYYAASRGLAQGTPQTPQQNALKALEHKRAFQEGRDIPAFASALETGAYNVVENGVSVVKTISPEWAGAFSVSEVTSRQLWHHGNPEDWGPDDPWVKRQTSTPEHQYSGHEDY